MLAVDKNQLVQNLKKRALELMQKELQFFVERYTNLATQASIVAGFAFDGLVEMEVPEECGTTPLLSRRDYDDGSGNDAEDGSYGALFDWRGGVCGVAAVYYVFDAAAMAFALYTVCVASFCTVYGHRLALQGPTGSVKKSVAVMKKQLQGLYRTFGLSMFSLVMAGVMMAWVKMGQAAALVTFVFITFFAALLYKFRVIMKLFYIPEHLTVTGELTLPSSGYGYGGQVDLSDLSANDSSGVQMGSTASKGNRKANEDDKSSKPVQEPSFFDNMKNLFKGATSTV